MLFSQVKLYIYKGLVHAMRSNGPQGKYVQYAAAISVDVEGGTLYTSDWAAFLAAEGKVRDEFEGNVVDLGAFRPMLFTSSNENNLI